MITTQAANESIHKAFGRTIGWFQCARSRGVFLSPSALRAEFDRRFTRYTEDAFLDFIDGYKAGFWEEFPNLTMPSLNRRSIMDEQRIAHAEGRP